MVTDNETNFVYFSSLIATQERYRTFWNRLKPILEKEGIKYGFLEGTKDIWCRDYMPVQVTTEKFIQFQYHPDYLKSPKWEHKLTKQDEIQYDLGINPINSELIIDGGNVVKGMNAVILTEKIFKENSEIEKKSLETALQHKFNTRNVFFIPTQPYDMTGHSDGMVRFLDSGTLLVSNYSGESESWKKKYAAALKNTNLENIEFPSITLNEKNEYGDYTARGCYINFVQIGDKILLPFFDLPEDELVRKEMKKLYPRNKILVVEANEIAQDGGVLNCITWNFLK